MAWNEPGGDKDPWGNKGNNNNGNNQGPPDLDEVAKKVQESLNKIFGVQDCGVIGDMLRGEIDSARHLQGFAANDISAGSHVAIGFNGMVEPYASELLQDPRTEAVLRDIDRQFEPDVMLFDLPPALLNDDVLALRPHIDALLLVAGGGTTRANDIKETERRLGKNIPLLGVVLNKDEQAEASDYAY